MSQFLGVLGDAASASRDTTACRDGGGTTRRNVRPAGCVASGWRLWAAGYGGGRASDGNAAIGSNNATNRVYGGVAGADYTISPFTRVGFALAGGGTSFGLANGLGSGWSDLFQAGAFIRHDIGQAYLSGALAYGWQDITTDRTVSVAGADQLRARFNTNMVSGRMEGGYRFGWSTFGVTPYAAGEFTALDLPAYAEQVRAGADTFALAYAGKTATATRSELGLRLDRSVALAEGILTLRGRVAWAHSFNDAPDTTATFQTLPGASFAVTGAATGRDAALVTASAETTWRNGWSAALTFDGAFSDVSQAYAGRGVLRYRW
jgi:uncharacterized protein with beta-barrel porin domain